MIIKRVVTFYAKSEFLKSVLVKMAVLFGTTLYRPAYRVTYSTDVVPVSIFRVVLQECPKDGSSKLLYYSVTKT